MTRAESIATYLAAHGITQVWAMQGGTIAAIIDACERHPALTVRYGVREDAVGYAVDGANRAAGRLVAAGLVTTGPGVGYLWPALMAANGDNVSCMFIAGTPSHGDDFQSDNEVWFEPRQQLWRISLTAQMQEGDVTTDEYAMHMPRSSYTRTIPACFTDWVARVDPHPAAECVDFLNSLADHIGDDGLVFSDAGLTAAIVWTVLHERLGDRLHLPYQQAGMGWAVPAAAGAAAATGRPALVITGDQSFTYQALSMETVHEHQLPVRVIVADDRGQGAIRLHQDRVLGGRRYGSDGLPHRLVRSLCELTGAELVDSRGWVE